MGTRLKLGAALSCVAAGLLIYGNLKGSALHRYVCGSDAPFTENMMWLLYGERTIDNLPARLCGCAPPPGYAEFKAKAGFHWENGRLRYTETGTDYAAIQLAIHLGSASEGKKAATSGETPK